MSVHSLTAGQHCCVVNQSKRPIFKNRSSCDHASGAVPARGTVFKKLYSVTFKRFLTLAPQLVKQGLEVLVGNVTV